MQRPLAFVGKAAGVAAVCLFAYRGVQLYYKNDVTIYITEVVHLPETAAQRRRPHTDPNLALTVEGKVEMETCLMSSYRFLLKLTGHVRTSLFDANKLSSNSPRSSRNRVLSVQTSSTYGTYRDDDSVSNCSVTGSRRHGPTLLITAVDPVVDAYETDSSGTIAFTPACIGEGMLCRYTCTAGSNGSNSGEEGGAGSVSPSASTGSPLVSRTPLQSGDSGLGNVYVRSCFLESDAETAYCQRLTLEVEFVRPVFGARVLVRLPSRHCRVHHTSSGGVGTVTQLLHQPRKCVWDIGVVPEEMCAVAMDESTEASASRRSAPAPDELMPGAVVPAAAPTSSSARLELVFEQPPPGIAFGEEDEHSVSEDSDDDEDNRFNSTVSSAKSASSRKRTSQGSSATGRGMGSSATSIGASGKTRKREERARKASEKAQRIQEGGGGSSSTEMRSRGNGDDVPEVELVYSVNQLLSGTSVKKLQVVQEAPNWAPRSLLDRLVLQRAVPSLSHMKLKKFAHYTTWFVQPVAVSRL